MRASERSFRKVEFLRLGRCARVNNLAGPAGLREHRHAVKRFFCRVHNAVVMRQHALLADEEVIAVGDLKVEDGLDLVGLDSFDHGDTANWSAAGRRASARGP